MLDFACGCREQFVAFCDFFVSESGQRWLSFRNLFETKENSGGIQPCPESLAGGIDLDVHHARNDEWRKLLAKHRAVTKSMSAPHALAVSVVSAGLMGAIAGPAMATELDTPVVSQVSIEIPELTTATHVRADDATIDDAEKIVRQASQKALPAAEKVNKKYAPKAKKVRDEAKPVTSQVKKQAQPVLDELQPVKKAVQPVIDKVLEDKTVATLVDTVIPVDELMTPKAKTRSKADVQRFRGMKILEAARTRIGDPYVWGATGPNAVDCSGLVMWAHQQLNITIPRTSQDQIAGGHAIARKDLQPGDIVAFYGNASHVGVYAGHNKVVHAPYQGQSVSESSLDSMPYYGATRYY